MQANKSFVLIEDDEVDILSIKRAFKELNVSNPLVIVKNGQDALDYLEGIQDNLPALIFLDLNMPKLNGIEFLQHIKAQDKLKVIPVVILTTSSNYVDINKSFENYAAGYIVKPMDFTNFKEIIRKVYDYWSICELPKQL